MGGSEETETETQEKKISAQQTMKRWMHPAMSEKKAADDVGVFSPHANKACAGASFHRTKALFKPYGSTTPDAQNYLCGLVRARPVSD